MAGRIITISVFGGLNVIVICERRLGRSEYSYLKDQQ